MLSGRVGRSGGSGGRSGGASAPYPSPEWLRHPPKANPPPARAHRPRCWWHVASRARHPIPRRVQPPPRPACRRLLRWTGEGSARREAHFPGSAWLVFSTGCPGRRSARHPCRRTPHRGRSTAELRASGTVSSNGRCRRAFPREPTSQSGRSRPEAVPRRSGARSLDGCTPPERRPGFLARLIRRRARCRPRDRGAGHSGSVLLCGDARRALVRAANGRSLRSGAGAGAAVAPARQSAR